MCPLRYILLLLSLLVAVIGISQVAKEMNDANSIQEEEEEEEANENTSKFQTLVDMLSGRYLMNAYYTRQAIKIN